MRNACLRGGLAIPNLNVGSHLQSRQSDRNGKWGYPSCVKNQRRTYVYVEYARFKFLCFELVYCSKALLLSHGFGRKAR